MATEGEKGQVKLIGATLSPYVVRVRIALALKGIDYEFIQENMQTKSELLLKSNPVHKKIPVLIHSGKPVSGLPLYYVEDKLFPSMRGVFTGQGEQLQKAVEDSVTNFLLIEEALRTNQCFAGKAYFGGDEIGLIDIALGGFSAFIKALEMATDSLLIDPEKMPLLSSWMDRFCKSEGVKEVMPDPAKQAEVMSAMRATMISPPTTN